MSRPRARAVRQAMPEIGSFSLPFRRSHETRAQDRVEPPLFKNLGRAAQAEIPPPRDALDSIAGRGTIPLTKSARWCALGRPTVERDTVPIVEGGCRWPC